MLLITRRKFAAVLAAPLAAQPKLDLLLKEGAERRGIPFAAAAVADSKNVLFQRSPEALFPIASMTKAITSASAMQLVEQGLVQLDEPVAKHLPVFSSARVLTGFRGSRPVYRPPARAVTLRHLLTHTSGLCYGAWHEEMAKWDKTADAKNAVLPPLQFDPGSRWHYGTGVDWVGRLVEKVSGLSLEEYFQKRFFVPLGMRDTSFIVPESKASRVVHMSQRLTDGTLQAIPFKPPPPPKMFNGGGGLYSTASDYVKFMQLILRGGEAEILSPKIVAMLRENAVGPLQAGVLKTTNPERSLDVDFHPGASDKHTLGFLLNLTPYEGGRASGSLCWAGMFNTFFWIDPANDRCATLMMRMLPFVDRGAMGLLREFEKAVYA
ncbi:MAG: beta-lactamase family protein [Acidobacteria bacterium]|nr:beta-lactamase family protein [Acidobacteriota bacterium]